MNIRVQFPSHKEYNNNVNRIFRRITRKEKTTAHTNNVLNTLPYKTTTIFFYEIPSISKSLYNSTSLLGTTLYVRKKKTTPKLLHMQISSTGLIYHFQRFDPGQSIRRGVFRLKEIVKLVKNSTRRKKITQILFTDSGVQNKKYMYECECKRRETKNQY